MADQLFLSYWLRNYSDSTMLRNYEKLLRLFPFSRLAQQASTFKIMAVDAERTRGGGDSLSSARSHRRRAGGSQRFPERRCLLSPGDVVGLVAVRWSNGSSLRRASRCAALAPSLIRARSGPADALDVQRSLGDCVS